MAARGPVVADTNVFGAALAAKSDLAQRYEPLLLGRPVLVSFQTAAEMRFGALRRGWGLSRMLKLEATLSTAEVIHTGTELVEAYARLRAECSAIGHGLGQAAHDADRWIAATARRLGLPLVSDDRIFEGVPG